MALGRAKFRDTVKANRSFFKHNQVIHDFVRAAKKKVLAWAEQSRLQSRSTNCSVKKPKHKIFGQKV